MRSKLVSLANDCVRNRFLLCHLTAEGARTLHHNSAPVHQTINDVLVLLADGKLTQSAPVAPEAEAEPEPSAALEALKPVL